MGGRYRPEHFAAVVVAAALAAWTSGCDAVLNPIYDDPEQVMHVEGLEGDWFNEETGAILRLEAAELDGLRGYRVVLLEDHAGQRYPDVLAGRFLVGEIDGDLVAEATGDWEATARLIPVEDEPRLQQFVERLEQDRLEDARILFRLELDDAAEALQFNVLAIGFGQLTALRAEKDNGPEFAVEQLGDWGALVDAEPGRMRAFLAEHADELWGDVGLTFERVQAEEFDQRLEELQGRE